MRGRRSFILVASVVLFLHALAARGNEAASECRTPDESQGYVVRSFKIDGRWVPSFERLGIADPVGTVYSPTLLADAETKVSAYLDRPENQVLAKAVVQSYEVLYVNACVRADDLTKVVDVVVSPWHVRLDLVRLGNNVLPIPRTGVASFLDAVPPPLLALNPRFSVRADRRAGIETGTEISMNLLDLPDLLAGTTPSPRPMRLDLFGGGSVSVDDGFYDSFARLTLSQRQETTAVEDLAAAAGFSAADRPLGAGHHERVAVDLGGDLTLRASWRWPDKATVGARYRWSDDTVTGAQTRFNMRTTEHAGELHSILDGQVAGAFARLGIWADAASPSRGGDWYQRLAGAMGYAKEFGATHQTLGVETTIGGGYGWGTLPAYARFFGGSRARNYLYDPPTAPSLTAFPVGPLIRSFGEAEATDARTGRGARSYWHANVNVAIPIAPWSRPLIPDVRVSGGETLTTIAERLKKVAITSAKSGIATDLMDNIIGDLKRQGVPDEEAESKAETIAAERAETIVARHIRPAVEFIADRANLFAVRPLLMIDAAGLDAWAPFDDRTRYGVGGGVQLTIVVAKLEVGYMHAVRRLAGDPTGRFMFRVIFDNLF